MVWYKHIIHVCRVKYNQVSKSRNDDIWYLLCRRNRSPTINHVHETKYGQSLTLHDMHKNLLLCEIFSNNIIIEIAHYGTKWYFLINSTFISKLISWSRHIVIYCICVWIVRYCVENFLLLSRDERWSIYKDKQRRPTVDIVVRVFRILLNTYIIMK